MRISDFIDASNRAESPRAVLGLTQRALASIGFERYAFCALTRHDRYRMDDTPPQPAIAFNYPSSWTDYYFEKQYQHIDPVLLHAALLERPFSWNWLLTARQLSGAQKRLMHQARDAGLHHGVAVPLHGGRGNICLLSCAASDAEPRPRSTLSRLAVMGAQLHLAYGSLRCPEPEYSALPILSPRERDCLQWIARGKSTWAVGQVLHISESTVNFHMKKLMKKLGAENRTMAVVIAIRMGLINL